MSSLNLTLLIYYDIIICLSLTLLRYHMFKLNNRYLILQHEELSIKIFKKLVVDNTDVLVEFVSLKEDLGLNEFKLIEHMIRPPEKGGKLPEPWKHREFLCEVSYAQ